MRRVAVLAAIAGGIGDLVLTNILGIPIALFVFNGAGLARIPQGQLGTAYLAALHASPVLYAAAIGVGIVASFFGGVIAALVSKHDRVLSGALSSWACLAIDAYTVATHTSTDGLLLQILLMPVAPLAGAFGGLAVRRVASAAQAGSVARAS